MTTRDPEPWPKASTGFRPWLDVAADWRRPGVPETYSLFWDDAAQFGQVSPRPSASAVAAYYDIDDYYTHEAEGAASDEPMRAWVYRALQAAAWRLDHGVRPTDSWWRGLAPGARSCVEIGCGHGDHLELLKPHLETVVGVEPDPAARANARERGIVVHDGLAETLPPEVAGRTFDLVVMTHVLEHCVDPVAALANAQGLLSDDGVLMVETPNNAALGCAWNGAAWYWLDVPRHLNFFTEESLRALCAHVGLAPVRAEYWGFDRQFTRSWIEAESLIQARLDGRPEPTRADVRRQLLRQVGLLARTAFAAPRRKYDSVRLICRKA